MKLRDFAPAVIDWSHVPEYEHPGETGTAKMKTHALGETQLRMVIYSADYLADHWCNRGHLVFVVDGQLAIDFNQGAPYSLVAGMSCCLPDDREIAHRVSSKEGATVFIVD